MRHFFEWQLRGGGGGGGSGILGQLFNRTDVLLCFFINFMFTIDCRYFCLRLNWLSESGKALGMAG